MGAPNPDVLNRRKFITPLAAGTRKAISGTAAQLGPMVPNVTYYLTADIDCFFRQGATGMTAPTTTTGDPLWSKERVQLSIEPGDVGVADYVDVVTTGTTGTAYLTRAD